MQSEVVEDCKCSYLHVPVEEAVFVHERQPLQHLVHDVADDRLREHSVPAADGEASSGHPQRHWSTCARLRQHSVTKQYTWIVYV